MVAHEVSHVVLDHRIDSQYASSIACLFDEKDTFKHFGFSRTQSEEEAANPRRTSLLKNSPYKDQLARRSSSQCPADSAEDIPN